jgi:integrase/recombinase XerD
VPVVVGVSRPSGSSGRAVVTCDEPLVSDYLEFLAGRARPNSVLAAAYDLRVFFTVVDKPPAGVTPADVLGFITAQRTGRPTVTTVSSAGDPGVGVAASTVARRLSSVSGFFAFCQARCPVGCRPVGNVTAPGKGCR